MDKTNSYQQKILKDRLKKEAIEKLDLIREKIEAEAPCTYGASFEQNIALIVEDLEDVLLNWQD